MINIIETQRYALEQEKARVITKAVINAANLLGLTDAQLAKTLGVDPSTVSRGKRTKILVKPGTKQYEFALMLIRVFRSLDAIAGGDTVYVKSWMSSENRSLQKRPIDMLGETMEFSRVVNYLDARRAIV